VYVEEKGLLAAEADHRASADKPGGESSERKSAFKPGAGVPL